MPVFWRSDAEGCIVEATRADNLDGSPTDATWISSTWLDAVHPDDHHEISAAWRAMPRIGRLPPIEYRCRQPDGQYRWMLTAAQPIMDADGRRTGWTGFVADIDDERRTRDALQNRERMLRLGIKATGLGIWEIELPSLKENWWPEAKAMVGLDPNDVVDGLRFRSLIHPDDVERAVGAFERCIAERDETPWEVSFRIRRADTGEERWIQEFGWLVIDGRTGLMRMVGALGDITDRKRAELQQQRDEKRWRLALQSARMVAWERDLATGMITRSANAIDVLGIQDEHQSDFLDRIDPRDRYVFERTKRSHRSGMPTAVQFRYHHPDGREVWLESVGTPVERDGVTVSIVGVASDITEKKRSEQQLQFAATHDGMTGVLNRDAFQTALGRAMARTYPDGEGVTLFMIDLDNFKDVNDSLGHDAGDAVLRATAYRLREELGEEAPIGRLGGDEFAMILPFANEVAGLLKARDMLDRIMLPVNYRGTTLSVRASIGIATSPKHHRNPEDLLKAADLALYRAKQEGRGRAVVFNPQMRQDLDNRVAISRGLQEALDNDEIEPFYQAKVDLKTGTVIGFEALARWNHRFQGILSAGAFAAALEDPELAYLVDERIVDKALVDIASLLQDGLDPGRIAFNMSTSSLTSAEASDRLLAKLQAAGVHPSLVQIEVTETVFLDRKADVVDGVLRRFQDAGITIALDDFGTGYASLTHLKRFPVDEIKVDKSFVRDLEVDEDDAAIVSAVIGLGANLGLAVVAEGVETQGQADLLRAWGCPIGQGYLFARPMPAAAVRTFLLGMPPATHGELDTVALRR